MNKSDFLKTYTTDPKAKAELDTLLHHSYIDGLDKGMKMYRKVRRRLPEVLKTELEFEAERLKHHAREVAKYVKGGRL